MKTQPVGARQLAFDRAWAEGLDLATAWERLMYLDGGGDGSKARSELARIREELKRIVRLNGRPDIAALLCRDPEAIVDKAARKRTLEEFQQGFEEDFYSEAELLEAPPGRAWQAGFQGFSAASTSPARAPVGFVAVAARQGRAPFPFRGRDSVLARLPGGQAACRRGHPYRR